MNFVNFKLDYEPHFSLVQAALQRYLNDNMLSLATLAATRRAPTTKLQHAISLKGIFASRKLS